MGDKGIICPHCGYDDSGVTDSRETIGGWRRMRVCKGCEGRFPTIEVLAEKHGQTGVLTVAGGSTAYKARHALLIQQLRAVIRGHEAWLALLESVEAMPEIKPIVPVSPGGGAVLQPGQILVPEIMPGVES